MNKYVDRLIQCGYSPNRAYQLCLDFTKNLSLADLEWFVATVMKRCG